MLAVVLVGGFGTRLRPLTTDVPKPMLPIVHRPMIERMVYRLAAGGVTEVVLALAFKPEHFAAAFPDHSVPGLDNLRIDYAVEPEPLDTAGAIAFAARHRGVDDTFVVANGDIVTDLDVGWLVSEHRRIGAAGTIHLTPVDDPSAYGVVETDAEWVRRFVEKPAPGETDSRAINAGTYVLEPEVLELIAPDERVSVERSTFPTLVDQHRLAAVLTTDYWIDAGRPETYLQANLDLITGVRGVEQAVATGAVIAPGADCLETVVGDGASIADGATVTRSVILPGAEIGRGARVTNSIVAGGVGAGASVEGCVIGAGYRVDPGSALSAVRVPA